MAKCGAPELTPWSVDLRTLAPNVAYCNIALNDAEDPMDLLGCLLYYRSKFPPHFPPSAGSPSISEISTLSGIAVGAGMAAARGPPVARGLEAQRLSL